MNFAMFAAILSDRSVDSICMCIIVVVLLVVTHRS